MPINYLIKGYKNFHEKYFQNPNSVYKHLSKQQKPKVMLISCSDSRVDPSIILDCEPGDIFVIRNVANLVPPFDNSHIGLHGVSAALEFGINILEIQHIIVMGHKNCAGIKTLLETQKPSNDFINDWVDIAKEAKNKLLELGIDTGSENARDFCEREAIKVSLNNLRTFPWIARGENAGKIEIHGWHFCLEKGTIEYYNKASDTFEDLK